MFLEFPVATKKRDEFVDITGEIREAVKNVKGLSNGQVVVFVPHTTAGITINENADPDVVHDMIGQLDSMVPWNNGYRHGEGNSAAHLKASMMGSSVTLIVRGGELCLGVWQSVYLCEFDGPRRRRVLVGVLGAP